MPARPIDVDQPGSDLLQVARVLASPILAALLVEVANGRPANEVGADYGRRMATAAPEDEPIAVLAGVARRHGFEPPPQRRTSSRASCRRHPTKTAARYIAIDQPLPETGEE